MFSLVKSTSKNYTISTFIGYYMFICKVIQNNTKTLPKTDSINSHSLCVFYYYHFVWKKRFES